MTSALGHKRGKLTLKPLPYLVRSLPVERGEATNGSEINLRPSFRVVLPWRGALGIFALAFVVYALSLSLGVFGWDSAELTLGIYSQGIVHSTGYPLYLILGRLFTLLPLSADFAIRANLFSAFCGALK